MKTLEGFTHLEVHSHFTFLGGTASPHELAARAAADGLTHLALTDTNGLYGAVAFERACRKTGVQPILGMTVTVAPPEEITPSRVGPGQLVLLTTGPEGYRSLCRLSSMVQGQPERERAAAQGLNWEALKSHRKGLICLSGGRRGWVERLIRADQMAGAHRYAGRMAGIYGENAFLNLELHGDADTEVAKTTIALAERLGMPYVAVQPVFCLAPQELSRLRLLAAIDYNLRLDQLPPESQPGNGDSSVSLHWSSPDEVAARYRALPKARKALTNVAEVTLRCEPALPEHRPIWPALKLSQGQTPDDALKKLANEGLVSNYGSDPPTSSSDRLMHELATISQHGYAPLFLVVADVTRYAREAGIPYSTRGSVANSLVAYCIGITTVDPMAHDLLFERFLSPTRTDPPDIDLDLCSRRRDEVLYYLREAYGADRVALVATISTLQPRSAVRETAKAYGLNEEEIKRLVANLPRGWMSRRKPADKVSLADVLAGLSKARWRDVIEAAAGVMGQPHHLSLHPGAVVITPGPLTDTIPVQWAPKGFLAAQFDHHDLEALGLPKIDLLGNRALTVLTDSAALVRKHFDPAFRLADIPLEDGPTGEMLSKGDTIGVFQCESTGARRTLRQLRARNLSDLAVANAFFKPGPATGGMAQTFVRRYRDEAQVSYLHSTLEPILGSTQGVLLFQEQILRVAREIAGLSWKEADQLRRGVNFRPEEMEEVREKFVNGCQARGDPPYTRQDAEQLWTQVAAFAGYGFNQGHALAYADISYRCAYLKAHWPAAFLCARLADRGGFHHPAIYIAEAVRLGIEVRPPHVNHSRRTFTLSFEESHPAAKIGPIPVLWMGLGQVRDLRRASIRAIIQERRQRPFEDPRDLLNRVALQAKEARHLIQCGALEGLGANRATLLAEASEIQRAGSAAQMAFAFAKLEARPESPAQRLAWEKRILGQVVSVHPVALVADHLPDHTRLCQLKRSNQRVTIVGVRLPGWTGGRGFFLGDGDTFVVVQGIDPAPPTWQPIVVHGKWTGDEWGTTWLQAEGMEKIDGAPLPS
jgi:DNA-directed DNA polymerase III PolC